MPNSEIRKIAFVGDYLPRKCGIATFTADVAEKLQRLDGLLQNAAEIVSELSAKAHPLLVRLGRVFASIPESDPRPAMR